MREGKSGPYEGDCGVLLQVQPGGIELEMGGGGAGQVDAGVKETMAGARACFSSAHDADSFVK